jgi:hypothetical protein
MIPSDFTGVKIFPPYPPNLSAVDVFYRDWGLAGPVIYFRNHFNLFNLCHLLPVAVFPQKV